MLTKELKKKISIIFLYKIQDIRLKYIHITELFLNKDLKYVKIYFIYKQNKIEENIQYILKLLNKSKNFIKKNISLMMKIKYLPKIVFLYDKDFNKNIDLINIINNF